MVEQGGAQASVQRQDGDAKPLADQRVGNALRADTFLTIVQKQTIPAIVVTAAMYQPPGGAVLLVVLRCANRGEQMTVAIGA